MTDESFIGREFLQHCGDTVRVLKKTTQKTKEGRFLFEIEYLNLPFREFRSKQEIIKGYCLNPRLEEEFMSKLYPQNQGDSIKILEKTNKKDKNGAYLYRCTFIEYPNEFLTSDKRHIKGGAFINYKHPLLSREAFIAYCLSLPYKPGVKDLMKTFKKSRKYIFEKIRVFEAREYVGNFNTEEDVVAEFIKSIYFGEIKRNTFKELNNKREIDIYLPDLKIGFEFNGIYWHSDIIFQKRGYKNAEEYHQEKYNLAKEKGIDLYFIKEEDWLNNKEEVKERIKHIIHKYTR